MGRYMICNRFCRLFFVFLFFCFIFVSVVAEDVVVGDDNEDLESVLGIESSGNNLEVSEVDSGNKISFGEGGGVSLEGKVFGGIESNNGYSGERSFIVVDNKGEIVEADFVVSEGGDFEFGANKFFASKGSRIFKRKDGMIQFLAQGGSELVSLPESSDMKILLTGEGLVLPDGRKMTGVLLFDGGDVILSSMDDLNGVEINGVGFTNFGDNDLTVSLEDEGMDGDFDIVVGEEVLRANSGAIVSFGVDNEIAKINENDHFAVKVVDGKFSLTNMVASGEIPILEFEGKSIIVDEDYMSFQVADGELLAPKNGLGISELDEFETRGGSTTSIFEGSSTSPIEMVLKDVDGKYIVKDVDGSEAKILISDYKEFAIVAPKAKEVVLANTYSESDLGRRITTGLLYNSIDLDSQEGWMESAKLFEKEMGFAISMSGVSGTGKVTKEHVRAVIDVFDKNPDLKEYVKQLNFYLGGSNYAFANPNDLSLNFNVGLLPSVEFLQSSGSTFPSIIVHEANHLWQDAFMEKTSSGYMEFLKDWNAASPYHAEDNNREYKKDPFKYGFVDSYGSTAYPNSIFRYEGGNQMMGKEDKTTFMEMNDARMAKNIVDSDIFRNKFFVAIKSYDGFAPMISSKRAAKVMDLAGYSDEQVKQFVYNKGDGSGRVGG